MAPRRDACLALASQRPVLVGVLGNSVAFGAQVKAHQAWPIVLQSLLRRRHNSTAARILNGAIRASRADFAALCWEELWGTWGPDGPPLDLAVMDYSFTSTASEQVALLDRLQSLRIPTVAMLHCAHVGWQRAVHCGVESKGYCEWRNGAPVAAPPIELAGERALGRGLRLDASGGRRRPPLDLPLGSLAGADREFSRLTALGLPARIANSARSYFMHGLNASADPIVFAGREGVHAAAAAASYNQGKLRGGTTRAAALLRRSVMEAGAVRPVVWRDALAAVAAGECWNSQREIVRELEARRVPFVSNVAQLSLLAEEVLTKRGSFGAHPNARIHALMASQIDELIAESCAAGRLRVTRRSQGAAAVAQQVCRIGERLQPLLERSDAAASPPPGGGPGFALVDPGGGRTQGLHSSVAGSAVRLRLRSTLRGGFLTVMYEQGWRNAALARLSCLGGCACAPMTLNASYHRPGKYTLNTLSHPPLWVQLAPARRNGSDGSDGTECLLELRLLACTAGRFSLTAVALAAPLPGNRTVFGKPSSRDALEMARESGRAEALRPLRP